MSHPFSFPFEPYPQQLELMEKIHHCIVTSSVGCFESPTGTGKSLSTICAVLEWLTNEEKRILDEIEDLKVRENNRKNDEKEVEAGDDWLQQMIDNSVPSTNCIRGSCSGEKQAALQAFTRMKRRVDNAQAAVAAAQAPLKRGEAFKGKVVSFLASTTSTPAAATTTAAAAAVRYGEIKGAAPSSSTSRHAHAFSDGTAEGDENEAFLLPLYDSDDKKAGKSSSSASDGSVAASTAPARRRRKLIREQLGIRDDYESGSSSDSDSSERDEDDESLIDSLQLPQLIYCTRTHSQIAQFVSEIKKTKFGSLVRCVSLGSRRAMCINSDVVRLVSESAISEKCLDMQKAKGTKQTKTSVGPATVDASGIQKRSKTKTVKTSTSCPHHARGSTTAMSNVLLGRLHDIEEMVVLGTGLSACPYYASRKALKNAQVVCMPYNLLLHQDLREAVGIDLKGKIVVVDEAHNLNDAINQLHSASIDADHLQTVTKALSLYTKRFQLLLSGKNVYYLNILAAVTKKLQRYALKAQNGTATSKDGSTVSKGTAGSTSTTTTSTTSTSSSSLVMTVNDFLFATGLDNINLFKLRRHMADTNLVNRIGGFADAQIAAAAAIASSSSSGGTTAGAVNIKSSASIDGVQQQQPQQQQQQQQYGSRLPTTTSSLRCLLSLLACLTTQDGDGRIFIHTNNDSSSDRLIAAATAAAAAAATAAAAAATATTTTTTSSTTSVAASSGRSISIQFVMLNPAVHFQPIVDKARSVILLGGTMQPFSLFRTHLLPQVPDSRIQFFACGHVVDPNNVLALVIGTGPTTGTTGTTGTSSQQLSQRRNVLNLTFTKRMAVEITNDIFEGIFAVCKNTPHGVVVFFTSYAYLELLVARWKASGRLARLQGVKPVFMEPRSVKGASDSSAAGNSTSKSHKKSSSKSDTNGSSGHNSSSENRDVAVWESYCAAAKRVGGAGGVLFSVIGGRLSEGINFSDDLARAVVVVGMPYPDRRDCVLQEKLKHANTVQLNSADRLYEAMCMKAVNQSIGRAIRHKNDYAAIVLMDARYAQPSVVTQLPSWIADTMSHCSNSSSSSSSNSSDSCGRTGSSNNRWDSNSQPTFEASIAKLQGFFAMHREREGSHSSKNATM